MVKIFGLIPRLESLAPQEFHDHYRHPHGTMGMRSPAIRRYVQSHQFSTPLLGPEQTRYEAVAETWFDGVAEAVAIAEDPNYVENVAPDEPLFVAMERLAWLFAEEEVILPGPGAGAPAAAADLPADFHLTRPVTVKLLHFAAAVEPPPDGAALDAARQVRCLPCTAAYGDGDPPAFAAVDELWWPTLTAFEQGVGRDGLAPLLGRPGSVTLAATAERFR
jgi:hypothetical protein